MTPASCPAAPVWLPPVLARRVDRLAHGLLQPAGTPAVDFGQPPGEAALAPADSVSWRVFKNPVAMFVGGVAAVILELAEPGVRTGVWEHSSFRTAPLQRLQRTGMAAMVTVYGARSVAEAMIAGVVRRHGQVTGHTPGGQPYAANDVDLLDWVQATAGFGFLQAYHRYVQPLDAAERDRFYAEGAPSARLYGAVGAPASEAALDALFTTMQGRLEPSPIEFEFLAIMSAAPLLPAGLGFLQRMLVRAAVDMTPAWVRDRLGLDASHGLRRGERALVTMIGRFSDRLVLPSSPAVQACLRLGLPADHLYRRPA